MFQYNRSASFSHTLCKQTPQLDNSWDFAVGVLIFAATKPCKTVVETLRLVTTARRGWC